MDRVKRTLKSVGWSRLIIFLFLVSLFVAAKYVGVRRDASLFNVLTRFGMNAVLVLAMVPMIQSGCGLNFGVPVGIIAGIIGSVLSLEFRVGGVAGLFLAMGIGLLFAIVFGIVYGMLLNRVKGDEMLIATYVGFSFVAFMNILWIILPFTNPASIQSFKGTGLRVTISVENYWIDTLSKFLNIKINDYLNIPTGMFLFFGVVAFLVWAFFRTKLGTAITAVGSNPDYARASGINIDRMRVISVVLSTCIAALGIIVYQQSFGFIQLYNSPISFTFPTVAAILIGGASINKATILNVIVGTILFQGILTMTPAVINSAINIDVSEVIRIIVTNGMIVYALTRRNK